MTKRNDYRILHMFKCMLKCMLFDVISRLLFADMFKYN